MNKEKENPEQKELPEENTGTETVPEGAAEAETETNVSLEASPEGTALTAGTEVTEGTAEGEQNPGGAENAAPEGTEESGNDPFLNALEAKEPNKTVPALGEEIKESEPGQTEGGIQPPEAQLPAERDREAEWKELAAAHPEIVGTTLPDDIYQACMTSELPPLRIYESMMMRKQAERITALEAEIARMRQNAETAARAPVLGIGGAAAPAEQDDPFLRGFNSYR